MEKKLLNALIWIVGILDSHNIPYTISGGFAAYLYGATRHINDIDIDIPEDSFDVIYDEIKQFIIFGPAHYKDERWDFILATLNFYGQEIDLGGAYTTKIYDDKNQKWVHEPVDFSKARNIIVNGISIAVMDPHNLISYKQLLAGEHQKNDIEAIQKYINKKL